MNDFTAAGGFGSAWEGIGHHQYRADHVDGVHCAGSVECHWRGETVDEWLAHRAAQIAEVAS